MPSLSSYRKVIGRLFNVVFLKQRLTIPTNLSQYPPHQGAFSTINFHRTLLFVKNSCISSECTTFRTSAALALNVLALSDIKVEGKPLRPQKRRNACRKVGADKSLTTSKCRALVEAQVNRHTYNFTTSSAVLVTFAYKGPAKSTPVWVNGGSELTRSAGRSAILGVGNAFPSKRLQTTHFLSTFLTASLPFMIQ